MITSISNEKIKEIKLLKNNKNILKEKKFIVEGEHLIIEAFKAGLLLETFALDEKDYGVKNTVVSSNVMESISFLNTASSVIGICKLEDNETKLKDKIIILDGIQDPGNLGTIIRSANAFGFNDIILSNNSVKKYNDKVLRATQGMIFNMNVITKDLASFIPYLKDNGYKVYGTDVVNGVNIKSITNCEKIAVVLGSEGSGISPLVKSLLDSNIYIPMNDSCESLNVGVAASIIMYEINNK